LFQRESLYIGVCQNGRGHTLVSQEASEEIAATLPERSLTVRRAPSAAVAPFLLSTRIASRFSPDRKKLVTSYWSSCSVDSPAPIRRPFRYASYSSSAAIFRSAAAGSSTVNDLRKKHGPSGTLPVSCCGDQIHWVPSAASTASGNSHAALNATKILRFHRKGR